MQKKVCVGKGEQSGGTLTVQQGALQRLEVDQTPTSAERSDRVPVQDPSAVINDTRVASADHPIRSASTESSNRNRRRRPSRGPQKSKTGARMRRYGRLLYNSR